MKLIIVFLSLAKGKTQNTKNDPRNSNKLLIFPWDHANKLSNENNYGHQ